MAVGSVVNYKLSAKALAIVILCLTFELVLTLVLLGLLSQAESETKRADRARSILRSSAALLKHFAREGAALSALRLTGNSEYVRQCESARKKLFAESDVIRKLIGDDPEEINAMKDIDAALENERALLDSFRAALLDVPAGLSFFELTGTKSELETAVLRLLQSVEELNEIENRKLDKLPSERLRRETVKTGLYWSLGANCMLAILLTVLFNRDVALRLSTVLRNSRNLADGRVLESPLAGRDEIAEVDRAFHHMAKVLAENARKERAIIDHAVDVICSIDRQYNFLVVNNASERVTGYAPSALIGRPVEAFVSAASMEYIKESTAAMQHEGSIRELEVEFVTSRGVVLDMVWSSHWSDVEQSLFCIMHDVSARKKLERMKQEFVRMVSHELKTPLCSAQMCLSMLSEGMYGELDVDGVEAVRGTEEGVARLVRLVNDLLDAEKMQAIQLLVRPRVTLVDKLIQEAHRAVEGFARESNVRLILEPPLGVYSLADSDRIVQVLVNLITNAVKYSNPGGDVSIGAVVTDDRVRFHVADRGKGIPAHLHNAVFEKFVQIDPRGGGVGLGLPISKEIVERHGGTMGLESDNGCRFWFTLPLCKNDASTCDIEEPLVTDSPEVHEEGSL